MNQHCRQLLLALFSSLIRVQLKLPLTPSWPLGCAVPHCSPKKCVLHQSRQDHPPHPSHTPTALQPPLHTNTPALSRVLQCFFLSWANREDRKSVAPACSVGGRLVVVVVRRCRSSWVRLLRGPLLEQVKGHSGGLAPVTVGARCLDAWAAQQVCVAGGLHGLARCLQGRGTETCGHGWGCACTRG